jgi:glycosyltransferase involved in cell wall biosynthesis
MAHIVIDARELRTSTGRYIERLLHYLQDIDTANDYTVLLTEKDFDTWDPKGKNFTKVITKYKEFSFGEQFGFAWQLKKLKPGLVHFGMIQQPLLYGGRKISTFHDLTSVRYRNPNKSALVYWLKVVPYIAVIWVASRTNKLLITPTEYVQEDVARFAKISTDKIIVTLEAADEFKGAASPVMSLVGKEFLLYVGRPQPHKNLGRLIEAFALLKNKHPNLLLVLAGKRDPIHEAHLAKAKKLGVDNSVVFTGFVSDNELKWLYQQCRAYVFPSLSEGFGLPALEAMMHGAPVVSSNATCLPEVCGDAAKYFNPKNVKDIADSIDLVLSDPDLRKKLTTKGYRRAKQFSWRQMAEKTLDAYEQALGM